MVGSFSALRRRGSAGRERRRPRRSTGGRHPRAVVAGLVVAVLTAGGVGYALWTVSGSGAAYSKASQSQALTTDDISAAVVGDLYPGGSGKVSIRINNPNVFPVEVTELTLGTVTPATCFVTASSPLNEASHPAQFPIAIPAGGESSTVDFAGAAQMGTSAGDACQNQLFTIAVTAMQASQA
jgi:hypothetical protein